MHDKRYYPTHDLENWWDDPVAERIKKECESICDWMLNEKCSIRQCAENVGLSKSHTHYLIHSYIRVYYSEEYDQIVRLLKFNLSERRKPRKYWSKGKEMFYQTDEIDEVSSYINEGWLLVYDDGQEIRKKEIK